MQSKTTRAFRTISEAADELDLQPHVLRFWESKFPSFKPIKRGGGRRFYRPEDIEFLRGIKILLHDERHPIKDVQKLIRVKGSARVAELGRSIRRASIPKDVKDTVLVPDHIQGSPREEMTDEPVQATANAGLADTQPHDFESESFFPAEEQASEAGEIAAEPVTEPARQDASVDDMPANTQGLDRVVAATLADDTPAYAERRSRLSVHSIEAVPTGLTDAERSELEGALGRLRELKQQWLAFKEDTPPQ